jgi:hypothetical protein
MIGAAAAAGCAVAPETETEDTTPELLSDDAQNGLSTIIIPSGAFIQTVGASTLETTRLAISSGSIWQSAAVSVSCPFNLISSVRACVKQFNPTSPLVGMVWCAQVDCINGPRTIDIPFPPLTDDATHGIALSVQRSNTGVSVNGAAMTAILNGQEIIVE